MPFKSEAQRKYLWANEPEIARDWTDTYGSRIQKAGGQLVQPGPGRPGYQGDMPPGVRGRQASEESGGTRGGYSDRERFQQQELRNEVRKQQADKREENVERFRNPQGFLPNTRTRNFFLDKVLAAKRWEGITEDDFYNLPPSEQDTKYKEYMSERLGGNIDAYGNPIDTGGGGGGQDPWLYPQGGIASIDDTTTTASTDLGGGHFQVPLDLVVNQQRAAEGGRIGFQRGGPPGGGDPGMRGTGRDYGSSYGPGRDPGWSPGVGGRQHIPTPRPAPRPDPAPTPDRFPGGGIRAINPYINVSQNWWDNPKREWEDYLRNTEILSTSLRDDDIPSDWRAEVTRPQYNTLKSLGQVGNVGGSAAEVKGLVPEGTFDSIQPSEWDQIFEGAKYKDIKQVVAEGGRIGYQEGNMVGAEMEGAEMEGAMMQSQEVIKELYDALIAQGLSPQEAMEKIKEMIAASQAQESESPMMGEEFPGQEFGRAPAAFGGIMDTYTGRRKYGLGSFFKSAKKKLKKLASSKLGKIALMYAAGTYLGGMEAFGGEGVGWQKFGRRLLDPMGPEGIANVGRTAAGWFSSPDPTKEVLKNVGGDKVPLPWYKDPWKVIPAASVAAGLYTAEEDEPEDISGKWDEDKADMDRYLANLGSYEGGDYRVPKQYRAAQGGRIGRQEGGLMDLGGMEKDYRDDGGFVPLGGEEKADDVPARLSKNEFVFTADAVRNAGGGDIDRGAEVMENVMKNLEAGGKVSEESQGQGAEEMFETSERLSEVI